MTETGKYEHYVNENRRGKGCVAGRWVVENPEEKHCDYDKQYPKTRKSGKIETIRL